jgi:putative ABC transport system substrate-binding protein
MRMPAVAAQEPGRLYRMVSLNLGRGNNAMREGWDEELQRSGFIEGKNFHEEIHIVASPAEAAARAETAAAAGVDLIYVGGSLGRAVQNVSRGVPIVAVGDDLVSDGVVTSLAHPGGNTTGVSILATELDGKRQELLIELVPGAHGLAALAQVTLDSQQARSLKSAAQARGVELAIYPIGKADEIAPAIEAAKSAGAQALNVLASALLNAQQQTILDRCAALKLPAIYQWPEIAELGGFAAYGPRYKELGRLVVQQIVRIFRGAHPGDLPVVQPDKFELVINLKTAKALGLMVPPLQLAQATQVIE